MLQGKCFYHPSPVRARFPMVKRHMAIGLLRDIIDTCPRGKSLLGLDRATKPIGLSVCASALSIATPLRTIQRKKFTLDIKDMQHEITQFAIGGYILGFPLNMDGTEGPRCQSVRHFADEM